MAKQIPVTDRALRYRANATPPPGPKLCGFCGAKDQIQVGHVNGHEEDGEATNLIWTCRSCNQICANALRKAGLGRLTRQYNPADAGAANVFQYALAVDSIQKRDKETGKLRGWETKTRPMDVQAAVAMIRATPHSDRSRFAREMWRNRQFRQNPAGPTFAQAMNMAKSAGAKIGDTSGFEPWLKKTKLNTRSDQVRSRLEKQFRQGVEEGEAEAEPTVREQAKYKGVRINKTSDGFQVAIDPGSRFDSLKDAHRFIDADLKANPRSAFHDAYRQAQGSQELRRKLQHTFGPGIIGDLKTIYERHLETAKRLRYIKSETRKMRASA